MILVLKRLRSQGHGLKSHPTDWEKPGIKTATPGLQDIGLSPTKKLQEFPDYTEMHINVMKYYTIIDFNEVDIRIYLPEKMIIHQGR